MRPMVHSRINIWLFLEMKPRQEENGERKRRQSPDIAKPRKEKAQMSAVASDSESLTPVVCVHSAEEEKKDDENTVNDSAKEDEDEDEDINNADSDDPYVLALQVACGDNLSGKPCEQKSCWKFIYISIPVFLSSRQKSKYHDDNLYIYLLISS